MTKVYATYDLTCICSSSQKHQSEDISREKKTETKKNNPKRKLWYKLFDLRNPTEQAKKPIDPYIKLPISIYTYINICENPQSIYIKRE